jgi:16S rRNA (guanine527-N7)-methyltransferase
MSRTGTAPHDLAADRNAAVASAGVSRETLAALDRFIELLLTWQRTTNLIAPSTTSHVWTRHVADSLQLLRLAPNARIWIDLGTGPGFPGMVIACALAGVPGAVVHLVESNQKKCAFLREAIRVTGAPAVVHCQRIEDFTGAFTGTVDVVTARALAPLVKALEFALPLLKRGAIGLFLKGQDIEVELTEAAKYWKIQASLAPSLTDPRGRIVIVQGLERVVQRPTRDAKHER